MELICSLENALAFAFSYGGMNAEGELLESWLSDMEDIVSMGEHPSPVHVNSLTSNLSVWFSNTFFFFFFPKYLFIWLSWVLVARSFVVWRLLVVAHSLQGMWT